MLFTSSVDYLTSTLFCQYTFLREQGIKPQRLGQNYSVSIIIDSRMFCETCIEPHVKKERRFSTCIITPSKIAVLVLAKRQLKMYIWFSFPPVLSIFFRQSKGFFLFVFQSFKADEQMSGKILALVLITTLARNVLILGKSLLEK